MDSHFTQQPYDPDQQSAPRSRFPIGALAWIPLSLMFGAGMVFAARYGYERATAELDIRQDPAAANETMSSPFTFDPGEEPLVLATEQKALRHHLMAPPGSVGSGTLIESNPLRLRIIERDLDLVRVIIVKGRLEGQRFWAKADRLLASPDPNGTGLKD